MIGYYYNRGGGRLCLRLCLPPPSPLSSFLLTWLTAVYVIMICLHINTNNKYISVFCLPYNWNLYLVDLDVLFWPEKNGLDLKLFHPLFSVWPENSGYNQHRIFLIPKSGWLENSGHDLNLRVRERGGVGLYAHNPRLKRSKLNKFKRARIRLTF